MKNSEKWHHLDLANILPVERFFQGSSYRPTGKFIARDA